MPEALAAVTVPSLVEGRAQLGDGVERHAVLDVLVIDDGVALAALDGDGRDLVLELAGLLRGLGLVLRGDGELVLLLARDLPLAGDVLGGRAHVVAVEGVPQAVLDHGVDHLDVAHLGAVAQVRGVRRLAHDSWPPATTMLASPLAICCMPSATARRPEPQSWLMPQAGARPECRRRSRPDGPGSGPGRRSASGPG
jgi:hypothetical protein